MKIFNKLVLFLAVPAFFMAGCAKDDGTEDCLSASAAMDEGRYADAADFLESACIKNPTNFNAFLNLAVCQLRLGDKKKAEGAVNGALKLNPDSAEAVILEGHIAFEKKDYTHALANFDYVIAEKSLPAKVRSVAYVSRSVVKYVEKKFDGAMVDVLMALSLNPIEESALNQIGIISRDSRYFVAANLHFAMAARCLPEGDTRRLRIENKILPDLRKRMEIDSGRNLRKKVSFADAKKAAASAKRGAAVDRAIALYRSAMDAEPLNQAVYASAVKFARNQGRWSVVVEFLQRSLLHEPGNKKSAKMMPEALLKTGRRAEAAAWKEYYESL